MFNAEGDAFHVFVGARGHTHTHTVCFGEKHQLFVYKKTP